MKGLYLAIVLILIPYLGIGQDPKKAEGLVSEGMKHFKAMEYRQAIDYFTQALEIKHDGDVYYQRGMSYYHLEQYDSCCTDLQSAARRANKLAQAYLNDFCNRIDTVYMDKSCNVVDKSNHEYMEITTTGKYTEYKNIQRLNREGKLVHDFCIDRSDTIYTVVEEKAEYPGGEMALVKYLSENLRFPDYARDHGISGRIFITFIIDKSGYVTDVQLLRGIGGGCDEEAMRVVSSMPKWTPAKINGKPVEIQYTIPINYSVRR
jgi:TonB family protein